MSALFLVACGLLVTATLDNGEPGTTVLPDSAATLDPPLLSLERRRGRIVLAGVAGSGADEAGLRRHAARRFTDAAIETHFRAGVIVPQDWQAVADSVLDVLAATDSATATIGTHGISLHAVVTDTGVIAATLDALHRVVAADMRLDADIIVVDPDIRLDALCRRVFERARTGTVTFPLSGAGIGGASRALLDRVVDFANDCRDFTIVIVGHSDDLGEESWNRQISLARASAVADYIVSAGIPAERLAVEGRGSSEPVADNGTPSGRRKNRRVEFELRESSL